MFPWLHLVEKKLSLHSKPWISTRIECIMAKRDKYSKSSAELKI